MMHPSDRGIDVWQEVSVFVWDDSFSTPNAVQLQRLASHWIVVTRVRRPTATPHLCTMNFP